MLNEARESCLNCTRKHLAQAEVLMGEARQGYPANRWRAIGHLGEAGDECCQDYPQLANEIRKHRIKYMADPDYVVPCLKLIEKASALVQESKSDYYASMAGTDWLAAAAKAEKGKLKRRPLKTLRKRGGK